MARIWVPAAGRGSFETDANLQSPSQSELALIQPGAQNQSELSPAGRDWILPLSRRSNAALRHQEKDGWSDKAEPSRR